jgi:uncharacterized repeat protein (TIGR03803 family)
MKRLISSALSAALVAGLCGAALGAEPAAPGSRSDFKTVHVFGQEDGPFATGVVEGRDGSLVGLTTFGGSSSAGEAFRLSPGGAFDVLHVFTGAPDDGENPYGRLIAASDGNFYGTTNRGGAFDLGTVFRLAPDGTLTLLRAFGAAGDTDSPFAGLVQARDGTLYGTTCSQAFGGFDAVYALSPAGDYRIVYRFRGGADGVCPHGTLIEAGDGLLYGTTLQGGQSNAGTAFSVSPSGHHVVLHAFTGGADGFQLQDALVQAADGQFYGTTSYGGAHGDGTVFRMDAAGSVTTLHDFFAASGDGATPDAGLVDGGDGFLYGTTTYGGSGGKACSLNPCGTLYRMALDGTLDILHDFGVTFMGAHPSAPLARISHHRIAGTADWRDAKVQGTIFVLRERP